MCGSRGFRHIDTEHGSECGNQDAMVLFIDMNDGAVKTFVLGEAMVGHQAKEEEAEEDAEKGRTHVWHDEHSFV